MEHPAGGPRNLGFSRRPGAEGPSPLRLGPTFLWAVLLQAWARPRLRPG